MDSLLFAFMALLYRYVFFPVLVLADIYGVFFVYKHYRLNMIRKCSQEEFMAASAKYENYPLFRHLLRYARMSAYCTLKMWGEMEEQASRYNLQNSPHIRITRIYLRCIVAAIHDNQIPIAELMLWKARNRNYQEITLVKALLKYHEGDTSLCTKLLSNINPSKFDAYYTGFYNLYLGLTNEGERQKEYFDKARQSNSPAVIAYMDEVVQKQKDNRI